MSMGSVININNFFALADTLWADIIGASILSLLILNPIVLKQFWRLFNLNSTFGIQLALSDALNAFFVIPSKSLEYVAHGCRAPPLPAYVFHSTY